VINRIWLHPPLAFARLGGSTTPCDNFQWAPSEATLKGNCRTRLAGATSLSVDKDGNVSAHRAGKSLQLKDSDGFRPVCPFFELHANWIDGDRAGHGAVTPALLKRFNLDLESVHWTVRVANRKAFHFTGAEGDIVSADVESIPGHITTKHVLRGVSKRGSDPLVPPGGEFAGIDFGSVQLTKPSPRFPQLRLRFTPPKGHVYAPTNLREQFCTIDADNKRLLEAFQRLATKVPDQLAQILLGFASLLVEHNKLWLQHAPNNGELIPAERWVLNSKAAWANWAWPNPENPLSVDTIAKLDAATLGKLPALTGVGDRSQLLRYLVAPETNVHNLPPGVFAYIARANRLLSGLGMLDDTSDGLIEVTIAGGNNGQSELTARARIAVTPPLVSPDRRSPLSLADGLSDRVRRAEVRKARWVSGEAAALSDAEVRDLLERAFEAAGLQNADAVNDFFRLENDGLAQLGGLGPSPGPPWSPALGQSVEPMPVTAAARRHHRRMLVRQVLEDFVRSHPDWVERLVRAPVDPNHYYDRRMPGLMRGFDRHPLALTRRQRDFLASWSARLSASLQGRTEEVP
jgi:hypothetical protein